MKFESVKKWLIDNSLWLAGLGLFVASSGIDGFYLVKLNAWGAVGGYALNTTSDVVGMLLMYWFGVFRQSPNQKKRDLSWGLLGSEVVTLLYSWLFSWRQYRQVIYTVEASALGGVREIEILAFVFAGFIPLLLAFVGFAQGLQTSDGQKASDVETAPDVARAFAAIELLKQELEYSRYPVATIADFWRIVAGMNGQRKQLVGKPAREVVEQVCRLGEMRPPIGMSNQTFANWAKEVEKS